LRPGVQQLEAPAWAACPIDGDVGTGQDLDVAQHRPFRDLETSCQVPCGESLAALQDHQEAKESARAHR